MSYEIRDNSGSLFRNEKKETDKHPNATGKAMIDGVMYYVSAWTKQGAKGPFQSLAFKPVETAERRAEVVRETRAATPIDIDDDLPF